MAVLQYINVIYSNPSLARSLPPTVIPIISYHDRLQMDHDSRILLNCSSQGRLPLL